MGGGAADALRGWLPTLPPDQIPYAELAILRAVEGDADEAVRVAQAATTPEMRSSTLAAVAAHLAGTEVTLAVDTASECASVRLHLALAHAVRGSDTHDGATARSLALTLLTTDTWASAVPLLPYLAPTALAPLAELALVHSSDGTHAA